MIEIESFLVSRDESKRRHGFPLNADQQYPNTWSTATKAQRILRCLPSRGSLTTVEA